MDAKFFESVTGLSVVLVGVLSILYVCKVFQRNARHVKFAQKVQGPRGWPLIGHSLDFWLGGTEGFRKLAEYGKKYGSVYRLWFGKHLVVVMSDPESIEPVFRKSDTQQKPEFFLIPFRRFLRNGLSTCYKDVWKVTRRHVQLLYGKKELNKYVVDVNEIICKFIRNMESSNAGSEFDICSKLHNITFNAITKSNFNMEFDEDELSELTIRSCNKTLSEIGFLAMFRSWLHVPLIYYLRYFWIQKNIRKDIRTFTNMVMEKNRESLALSEGNLNPDSSMPFLSILHHIMRDENSLNEDWLHDQIAFLTIAGTDGVAVMMSFFLISIALDPLIQEKLQQELDDMFGDDDRQATYTDLERLVYLDQVLKETERRYTFVPFIFRNVDVDTTIGNHTLPAGTAILINIDQIHHNAKYYPDPLKFNPDNFSPEAISRRPPLSFIPFSSGPRNCVAVHYATLIMKLTLVALLRKFQFETTMISDNIKVNVGFITTCASGYNVSIKLRK